MVTAGRRGFLLEEVSGDPHVTMMSFPSAWLGVMWVSVRRNWLGDVFVLYDSVVCVLQTRTRAHPRTPRWTAT